MTEKSCPLLSLDIVISVDILNILRYSAMMYEKIVERHNCIGRGAATYTTINSGLTAPLMMLNSYKSSIHKSIINYAKY